jgi:protein TonB
MNKRKILVIALVTLTMSATAQNVDSVRVENNSVQAPPMEANALPVYPGGKSALSKFLTKNIQYPDAAEAYGVEGTVTMSFFVNEDGSLSDISAHDCKLDRFNTTKFSQETEVRQKQLKEQFAKLFAKEGARVIRKMPKWTPGKVNGKAARIKVQQRIKFSIPSK